MVLAEAITKALSSIETNRNEFDVIVVVLPERWHAAFFGRPDEDFDLHDFLKAMTASRGIPLQILQEMSAFRYPCRCSVMWRLSIALYCKAGGTPWKLAGSDPDAAFVGLSYALRSGKCRKGAFRDLL